jgi:hypothetical protein
MPITFSVVAAISPLIAVFVAVIWSVTRVIRVSPVIFIVFTAQERLSHAIFAISPNVRNFHQLGNGFQLQATELLDVGFSSNAVTKGINFPVDGDIVGYIQEVGEAPDI